MKRILLALGALALAAWAAHAASYATPTETRNAYYGLRKISWAWGSTAAGRASASTTNTYVGQIVSAYSLIPTDTASSPTNQYNIFVRDADGVDVLMNQGRDLRTPGDADNVYSGDDGVDGQGLLTSGLARFVDNSILTLYVTAAGASASDCTFILVIKE